MSAARSAGRRRRRRLAVGAVAVVAGIVAGVLLVASGTFDKAIQELTLPLRHEDIIRQQAARKGRRRGADRRRHLLRVEVQRPRPRAPAPAA